MNRVRVLVEGQTEQAFIRDVLRPHFDPRQIFLHAVKFRRQGGITPYERAKEVILRSLKEDADLICTTMVDFYGMPEDWPGRKQANRCRICTEKAFIIEAGILKDITGQLGNSFYPNRLMPYVQMHEFDALLFSSPAKLAQSLGSGKLSTTFVDIRNKFSTPEEINDHYDTCPSRRIEKVHEDFKKTIDGISAASRIGLETMRRECPHFNEWITKLEGIGNQ
jgi:hypothetical protein